MTNDKNRGSRKTKAHHAIIGKICTVLVILSVAKDLKLRQNVLSISAIIFAQLKEER
jgi:hypothetical protein